MYIDQKLIDNIVNRVLAEVQAERVILFGSAGRGEMGPNSDLDILVVMPSGVHRRNTARSIYRNLIGVGFAADIVVVTEQDIELYHDNIGMVIKPAIEQGKLLYAS